MKVSHRIAARKTYRRRKAARRPLLDLVAEVLVLPSSVICAPAPSAEILRAALSRRSRFCIQQLANPQHCTSVDALPAAAENFRFLVWKKLQLGGFRSRAPVPTTPDGARSGSGRARDSRVLDALRLERQCAERVRGASFAARLN